ADCRRYDSPKALGEKSDAVVLNVSDTPDVEELALGENGLIRGMKAGGIVIDMSTIAPAAARRIAAKLAEKEIYFLDAPVSGGQKGAVDGTLTIMAGGEKSAFARALPLLQTMGKTITHVGESGAGQVVKACNQIIIGATVEGVAEAFVLAQKNGVNPAAARIALMGGFAASKVLESHGMRMLENNFAPGFKAVLHDKDMKIALECGAENGCPLPSAKLFADRMEKLIAQGGGELDSTAAYKIVVEEAE
ncbi:MAG: NAD(P)-dependent oxidoreductase, partial [Betaproteobacteria bacterium]|nr:NAD(P)-dependent oxidoreductase [Betaproteobacteria bacterium]